jgi:hypothetical protein
MSGGLARLAYSGGLSGVQFKKEGNTSSFTVQFSRHEGV